MRLGGTEIITIIKGKKKRMPPPVYLVHGRTGHDDDIRAIGCGRWGWGGGGGRGQLFDVIAAAANDNYCAAV